MPSISLPTPPGGHIAVSEAALSGGSAPDPARTKGDFTFTVSAQDGIDDLTVGGLAAIRDGVFSPGSIAHEFGRLSVLAFDAATGAVSVRYEVTTAFDSATAGPQQRYGDIFSLSVLLTDRDGDTPQTSLVVQVRDDEAVVLSSNAAVAPAGSAASGNVVTDGTPDRFGADGFGGISGLGLASLGSASVTPNSSGDFVLAGAYGVLTLSASGAYSYAVRADAPAGARDDFIYFAKDGDGDQGQAILSLIVAAAPLGHTGGGEVLTSPAPDWMLSGGSGDDTLNASRGSDTLTGGPGDDVFAWAREPWSPATLTDFRVGEDRLDLSAVFQASGYAGSHAEADGRIVLLGRDGDTLVLFDDDGAGGEWPNYIIKLSGVSAVGLTWDQLASVEGESPPAAQGRLLHSERPGDTLAGGGGDDTLNASRGSDVLTGGAGADLFVFADEPWSPARITDFQPGRDKIDVSGVLSDWGYSGAAPLSDGHVILLARDADTLVLLDDDGPGGEWGNYVLRLEGVQPGQLSAGDWVFR